MRASLAGLLAATLLACGGLVWWVGSDGGRPPVSAARSALPAADAAAPLEPARVAAPLAEPPPLAVLERTPGVTLAAAPPSAPPEGSERERALLASADPRLRFEGLRLQAARAPRETLPKLLEFIESTRDSEPPLLQRITAVRMLGTLQGVSSASELFQLYQEEDPGIRRAAAKALEEQGDPSLLERELEALRPALANPDGGERARAAGELARFASPSAIPALLPLLSDANSEVRAQAVDGLWLAADPALVPELERMLTDPVEHVRERARRALAALHAR